MGKLFDMKWSLINDIMNGRLRSTVDFRDRFDELINTAMLEKDMCTQCERPAVKNGLCSFCIAWFEVMDKE